MRYISQPRSPSKLHQLGVENERRFFEAMLNHPVNLPFGVYKIERATAEEDARGIDAWAVTEYGRIPVQVKSSCIGLDHHLDHYRELNAVVVVIHVTETIKEIQTNAVLRLRTRMDCEKAKRNTQRRKARW